MQEIAPGILHWTAFHPRIRVDVSSYYAPDSGTLIDPLFPGDDIEPLRGRRVERIVLTNRHHLRSSEAIASEFGCPILCHEAGMHEFEGGPKVESFGWGDALAPGVRALEVDAICDEESAILLDAGGGSLAVADAVVRYRGKLRFVPDDLIGDDPEAVKTAIRDAYRRLLDQPFENLLTAHGEPCIGGAHEELRRFVEPGS